MESDTLTKPRPLMEPDQVYMLFLKELQHVSEHMGLVCLLCQVLIMLPWPADVLMSLWLMHIDSWIYLPKLMQFIFNLDMGLSYIALPRHTFGILYSTFPYYVYAAAINPITHLITSSVSKCSA